MYGITCTLVLRPNSKFLEQISEANSVPEQMHY